MELKWNLRNPFQLLLNQIILSLIEILYWILIKSFPFLNLNKTNLCVTSLKIVIRWKIQLAYWTRDFGLNYR